MMNQIGKFTHVFVALAVFLVMVIGPQKEFFAAQDARPQNESEPSVEVSTRITETMVVPTRTGTPVSFRVTLKEWHLAGHERNFTITEQGFYIAQLRWGEISTQIGEKSEIRHPGDFWVVQERTSMVIRMKAPREDALIQTFSVTAP